MAVIVRASKSQMPWESSIPVREALGGLLALFDPMFHGKGKLEEQKSHPAHDPKRQHIAPVKIPNDEHRYEKYENGTRRNVLELLFDDWIHFLRKLLRATKVQPKLPSSGMPSEVARPTRLRYVFINCQDFRPCCVVYS